MRTAGTLIWVSLALMLGAAKCNQTDQDDFDRAGLLRQIGSELIVPEYEAMSSELSDLEASLQDLQSTPSIAQIQTVKAEYEQAYIQWQHCKAFDFGPAMDIGLLSGMSTYPTDTVVIESNIAAGTYTLGSISNRVAIGLPALDYLLYHTDESTLLADLTTGQYASQRLQYMADLASKMKTEVVSVHDQWNNGYLSTFTSDDGNTSTSPITFLFNSFIKDYELIKNAKLGIPLGVDNAGVARPEYAEAPYSGISLQLVRENVESIESIFLGRGRSGVNGVGFDDYADDRGAEYSGTPLSDAIASKFAAIYAKIDVLSSAVHEGVVNDWQEYYDLYTEVKNLVALIKTDLASSTSILITYQDNDGD